MVTGIIEVATLVKIQEMHQQNKPSPENACINTYTIKHMALQLLKKK